MKRKILLTILVVIILLLTVIWLIIDGGYVINKYTLSDLEFINKYGEIQFNDTAIVEKFVITEDYEKFQYSRNKALKALVLVPNEEAEKILSEIEIKNEKRNPEYYYEYENYIFDNYMKELQDDANEKFDGYRYLIHSVKNFNVDREWRKICYTLSITEQYTKFYIYIDKLDWKSNNDSYFALTDSQTLFSIK